MKSIGVDGGATGLSKEKAFKIEVRLLSEAHGGSSAQACAKVHVVNTVSIQLGKSVVHAALAHDRRHTAKGVIQIVDR